MTFQEDAKFGVNGMKNKVSFLRIGVELKREEGKKKFCEKKNETKKRKEIKKKIQRVTYSEMETIHEHQRPYKID